MELKAFIVHKAQPWNKTEGSLLLLFKEFGMKMWLQPRFIDNYNDLNHDTQAEQNIEVSEETGEMIRIGIYQKKNELLKYKKGAKI